MDTINRMLQGRKIVAVREERDATSPSQEMLVMTLDDGSALAVTERGGPGADANWYTFPSVRLNGKEIWHG